MKVSKMKTISTQAIKNVFKCDVDQATSELLHVLRVEFELKQDKQAQDTKKQIKILKRQFVKV